MIRDKLVSLGANEDTGLLVGPADKSRMADWLAECGFGARVLTPAELDTCASFDTLLICRWFPRAVMRRLEHSGFARQYHYLLFSHQHVWLKNLRRADLKYRAELRSQLLQQGRKWKQRYGLAKPPTAATTSEQSIEAEPIVNERLDFDAWLENLARDHLERMSCKPPSKAKVQRAYPVFFDEYDYFYVARPKSRVLCVNRLLESDRINIKADLLLGPFFKIAVGDVLAFPIEEREDVIDALADRFLKDAPAQRQLAGLWRQAIDRFNQNLGGDLAALRDRLKAGGLVRTEQTLRLWLGRGSMVRPRLERDLALIASITDDERMKSRFDAMMTAIRAIYEARRKAGKHFLSQISQVDLEAGREIVAVPILEREFHFRVLRIARIDPPKPLPVELIGRLHQLSPQSPAEEAPHAQD
jgi:hypothetical protein